MPRKTALAALERCRRDGAWSGQVLSALLLQRPLNPRDSALASRLFYGCLQNLALLDHCLAQYTKGKLEPKVRDILRLGVYQILLMDRIPVSAAVNESVKLCKDGRLTRAAGLVNAVLRRIATDGIPEIPGKGSAAHLSTRYSHPLWIAEELIALRGYEGAEAVLQANNAAAPTYIQTNTLKISPEGLAEKLRLSPREDLPGCFLLNNEGGIAQLPGFREGLFYVQDPAARMAVQMAGPKPGMAVLDACSAPGGKSFACALEMENRGQILSCDISESKLRLVQEGAARLGLDCIRCQSSDARSFSGENFDLVIADVPCSGMGVIRKKPDIRYRDPEGVARIPVLQLEILENLAKAVSPGGALAYSTCTWRREENEGVTRAFLENNNEFIIEKERTFWPDLDDTDGFYLCLMRRKKI